MSPYPYLLVILSITLSFIFTEAHNGGFSVELIHRDSPKSPLYNPNETHFQRLTNMLHRSIKRLNHFKSFSNSLSSLPQPIITNTQGEFLMKYSIGTPPVEIMGLMDTGSDLIWLQCEPCEKCYDQTSPIFDPIDSKTYEDVTCPSIECEQVVGSTCSSSSCQYNIAYEGDSFSKGYAAYDTINLRTTGSGSISFPKILIGCGHENVGRFTPGFSGLIGLGSGFTSLISQIIQPIDYKFSYCLTPILDFDTTSKLNFGSNAIVSDSGIVPTPLAFGPIATFYYASLEGVTVGSKRIEYFGGTKEAKSTNAEGDLMGNIIIDTGTALTFLPEAIFIEMQSTIRSLIKLNTTISDPLELRRLCYISPEIVLQRTPYITLHFAGGADMALTPTNTFVASSTDTLCFAFASAGTLSQGTSILGSIAQTNFLVGFDRQKRTVTFQPVDCTMFSSSNMLSNLLYN